MTPMAEVLRWLRNPPGLKSAAQARQRQYKERARLVTWIGGGLAGVIAIYTAERGLADSEKVPVWLLVLPLILVVFGGACLAMARVTFEHLSDKIANQIQDGVLNKEQMLPADLLVYPAKAEAFYYAELAATIVAGVSILAMSFVIAL